MILTLFSHSEDPILDGISVQIFSNAATVLLRRGLAGVGHFVHPKKMTLGSGDRGCAVCPRNNHAFVNVTTLHVSGASRSHLRLLLRS
jgi:hypothetical protein